MGLFADCGCGCDGKKQEKKLLISLMAALTFFIIASPETFRIMRSILGKWVSSPTGCPTPSGLILHTIVFLLVTWGLMNVKNEGYEPETMSNDSELVDDAVDEDLDKFTQQLGGRFQQMMSGSTSEAGSPAVKAPLPPTEEMEMDAPPPMVMPPPTDTDMPPLDIPPPTDTDMPPLDMPPLDMPPVDAPTMDTSITDIPTMDMPTMDMPSLPISTTQKSNGDPSRPGLVPTRMADAPTPLPGFVEEPIGFYDSGSMFGSMDIYGEIDSPASMKSGMRTNTINVSCGDGSRPVVY